jgi:hypothetical protein
MMVAMPADRLALLLLLATTCKGCVVPGAATGSGYTTLFVKSSLDHNLGKPHRLTLEGGDLAGVADRLIGLARQRDLALVQQLGCGHGGPGCSLAFRGKPVDRRIFRGTQSQTMSYYSRYFVTIEHRGGKIRLSAVGVPVLGGEMSCPPGLRKRARCTAPRLRRPSGSTLVAAVKREWGYDVSGANEAETLQGLLAELERASVRGAGAEAAGPVSVEPPRPRGAPPPGPPGAADRKAYETLRRQGKACYRQRDYRCALERFAAALERIPDPAMRFNLASAQDKLGLAALAVRNYRRYLKDSAGTVPAQALAHITRRMETLVRRVGQVRVSVTPAEASLLLNDVPQLRAALATRKGTSTTWDLVLDPGSYQLVVRHPGRPSRSLTITVLAGDQRRLDVSL